MEKVFCEECDNYFNEKCFIDGGSPISRHGGIERNPCEINKNNDCKDFTEKVSDKTNYLSLLFWVGFCIVVSVFTVAIKRCG